MLIVVHTWFFFNLIKCLYLDEITSTALLKVTLNTIPVKQCNELFYIDNSNNIPRGIDDSSMICSGYLKGGKDTCSVRILLYIYTRKYIDK